MREAIKQLCLLGLYVDLTKVKPFHSNVIELVESVLGAGLVEAYFEFELLMLKVTHLYIFLPR